MIYEPRLDKFVRLIISSIGQFGSPFGSQEALQYVRDQGRISIHYVLRYIEQPDSDEDVFWHRSNIAVSMRLLEWYAENNMMSLDELQRYRRILTAEKKYAT